MIVFILFLFFLTLLIVSLTMASSLGLYDNSYERVFTHLRKQENKALSQYLDKMGIKAKKKLLYRLQENVSDWQKFLTPNALQVLLQHGYDINHISSFRPTPSSHTQKETLFTHSFHKQRSLGVSMIVGGSDYAAFQKETKEEEEPAKRLSTTESLYLFLLEHYKYNLEQLQDFIAQAKTSEFQFEAAYLQPLYSLRDKCLLEQEVHKVVVLGNLRFAKSSKI